MRTGRWAPKATDLANVFKQLEAGRAEHVVGRGFAREEREDRREDVAFVEPAVDKVRVDLEAGPEEADGGCVGR
jgi:hypothetical protein